MKVDPPAWVDDYVGIEWTDRGRTRADGVDCWGLGVVLFAEHRQIALPRHDSVGWAKGDGNAADHGQSKRAAIWRVIAAERAAWSLVSPKPIDLAQAQCFDALLIEFSGVPIHIGFVVAPGWVLHIQQGCNSVCEPFPSWRIPHNRIEGLYRHAA